MKSLLLILLLIPITLLSQSFNNFNSVEYKMRLTRAKNISEMHWAVNSLYKKNECRNSGDQSLSAYLPSSDSLSNKSGLFSYNINPNYLYTDNFESTDIFSQADSLALLKIDANCDIADSLNWDSEPNPMNWEGVTWDNGIPKRVRRLEIERKSLSGILNITPFDSITFLDGNHNNIDSLLIGNQGQLTDVLFSYNNLTYFDISTLTNLIYIDVYDNNITQINISDRNNSKLEFLICGHNNIPNLNFMSKLKNLKFLSIAYMPFDTLYFPENDSLEYLGCVDNNAKYLDVSNLIKLKYLYCQKNNLTELNLDKQKNLYDLYCWKNQLTELDVSVCTYLFELKCMNNKLTELDISIHPNMYLFDCAFNRLTHLNFGDHPDLFQYFDCSNNLLSEIDLSSGKELLGCVLKNNKLPFSSLATKPDLSSHQSFFPQNTLYDTLSIEGNTTLDYSAEAIIRDNYATEFIFYKDKNVLDTNATGIFKTNGNGVYYCEMTNPLFPSFTLKTSPVTITGATEIITESEPQFSYYPNPVTDMLHINNAQNCKVQKLSICNIEGKELLLFKNARMPFDIDLTNYKSGLYICKLISNNKEYSFEILKK